VDTRASLSRRRLISGAALTAVAIAAGVRITNTPAIADHGGKIGITSTVGMITDVLRTIGGEQVVVSGLMGPGIDPHLYKPSAGDIILLGDADIIFYGGLHLEGRMTETFEKILRSGKPTIPVSESIPEHLLRSPAEFQGAHDPHVWFDVTLWRIAAETMISELASHFPDAIETFQTNGASYLAELDDLDAWVQEQVARVPEGQRVLITAHDAFGYFGARYGFEVRGLQGFSTATEAGAGDVQDLATFITERRIRAMFVESSVPPATVEAVQEACRAKGWDVRIGGELFSDAMGQDGTVEGTYIGMVRHNVDTIVSALLGEDDE
jgi:manganese/zinc/iron transport system substrate-binding protein